MPKVRLLVAESVEHDDVWALDPHFAHNDSNATREWVEARVFNSQEECIAWCKESRVPFVPMELTFEFDYLQ